MNVPTDTMKILQSTDPCAIKDLIVSKCQYIGQSLRMINLISTEPDSQLESSAIAPANIIYPLIQLIGQSVINNFLRLVGLSMLKHFLNANTSNLDPARKSFYSSAQVRKFFGARTHDIERRRVINKHFFNCLLEVEGDKPSALIWLKKHIDLEICEIMMSDIENTGTMMQIVKQKTFSTKEELESDVAQAFKTNCGCCFISICKFTYNSFRRFITMTLSYLDLGFDSILLGTILKVLGASIIGNYELFSSQVALLLLASILVPSWITAFSIARNRPLVVVGSDQWIQRLSHGRCKMFFLQIIIMVCSLIVPALVIRAEEKAQEKRKILVARIKKSPDNVQGSDLEELELLTRFLNESRLALLTFRRNELSIEIGWFFL